MGPKRIALWCLIASIAASAVLGTVLVLTGSFSDLQIRIIFTTLTISGASICALAAGALREQRQEKFFSLAGWVLALISAILIVAGIWTETRNQEFWKLTISIALLAVATAHVCLVALAKLARRFAWNRIAALVAVYLLAGLIIFVIYFPPRGDTLVRIIGATSIIVAALTILTPIFHRLSRGDLDASVGAALNQSPALFATISCPQCGALQPNQSGTLGCANCGCKFVVQILEPGQTTKDGVVA
jgi:hypothetical protein